MPENGPTPVPWLFFGLVIQQALGVEEDEPTGELNEMERRQILRALQETGGNKAKAAEILGIQRRTLYKKLARIEREPGTPADGDS